VLYGPVQAGDVGQQPQAKPRHVEQVPYPQPTSCYPASCADSYEL
jgi:hypothetical protein